MTGKGMSLRTRAHGIMFHHFHDDGKHPVGQGSITGDQFDDMIRWLQARYRLLTAPEWQSKAEQGQLHERDICITFDDNLLCQYEIAGPVLEHHGLGAFWFVYTSPLTGVLERLEIYRYFRSTRFPHINDFYTAFHSALSATPHQALVDEKLPDLDLNVFLASFPFYSDEDRIFRYIRDQILGPERYYDVMDAMVATSDLDVVELGKILWSGADELKDLQEKGHVIGLHSHTHPTRLNALDRGGQEMEYGKNYEILREVLGNAPTSASHPCNSYNADTVAVMQKLGVTTAFRANMDPGYDSAWEYPRLDHALLLKEMNHA